MDQLAVQCTNPDCARWLRAAPAALGHRIRCPVCHQEVRVPGTLDEVRKLENARYHRLRVAKGPAFLGSEYRLERDRAYTVGRSDDCNLQFPGPTISKRHFSLHWVNNQWVLEDLNTTTGTQVNGLAVTKQALRGGEKIEIGVYKLEFLAPGARCKADLAAPGHLVAPTNAEPLPLHEIDEAERAQHEADQVLRDARGYTSFTAEHLAAVGKSSWFAFKLGLATRLVIAAALLLVVTLVSIYAKSWFTRKPSAQAQAGIPPDFTAALEGDRFEVAAAVLEQLQADPNDVRLPEMQQSFQDKVHRYRSNLLAQARQALDKDDWAMAAERLQTAQAPVLGPLESEWLSVTEELKQKEVLERAQELLAEDRWAEARTELEKAVTQSLSMHAKQRVQLLQKQVNEAQGGGLVVSVEPEDAEAQVTLDGTEIALDGQENWRLPVGRHNLVVSAPGFFAVKRPVDLMAGKLRREDVALAATAPAAAWALLALETADNLPALWVAAKHYGLTGAVPPTWTQAVTDRVESDVLRKLGSAKLRVARLTLKNGDELTARVWDTGAGLSALVLPEGTSRTISSADIAKTQDLNAEDAVTAVLGSLRYCRAAREGRASPLETLEGLAKLYSGLPEQNELVDRVCSEFLNEVLGAVETSCARCAGIGDTPCGRCEAKGTVLAEVTCPRCKGTQLQECPKCNGHGEVNCDRCGGTGSLSGKRNDGGFINKDYTETCRRCEGKGKLKCSDCKGERQVTCRKCKGTGAIDEKQPCPACKKGRVLCPVCEGDGSKGGMNPDKRQEAEHEAAARMSAAGG